MFTKFLYIVVIAFILFIIGGFFLPRFVHVERSIEINRPAPPVFALLNSYRTFASWSPWAERDPAAVYEFSGPESGVGARMNWSGDPRLVGSGWQEIIESTPHTLVRTRLFFDQQGAAESYFQLAEQGGSVVVTWGFDSDLTAGQGLLGSFLTRYFGLMFDRWIGTDYEQGLTKLKEYAEGLPVAVKVRAEIDVIDAPALDIFYVSTGAGPAPEAVAQSLTLAYQEISAVMSEKGIEMAGRPMSINYSGGERGYQLDAAIPFRADVSAPEDQEQPGQVLSEPADSNQAAVIETGERVRRGQSPSGPVVRIVHRGSYDNMTDSYQKLAAYMEVHGLPEGNVSWEYYVSDPGETPEDELITHIYFQIGK